MTYRKNTLARKLSALLRLAAAILLSVSFAACTIDTETENSNNTWADTGQSVIYEGRWTVESATSDGSRAVISASNITIETIPSADIIKQFLPNADPATATAAMSCHALACSLTSADSGTQLYSIRPTIWEMSAMADGQKHSVSLVFAPSGNGADNISWATMSKSGVLTLILHATAVSIDGEEAKPTSLTLTYTATRK